LLVCCFSVKLSFHHHLGQATFLHQPGQPECFLKAQLCHFSVAHL
jgi:hypothetical protein